MLVSSTTITQILARANASAKEFCINCASFCSLGFCV